MSDIAEADGGGGRNGWRKYVLWFVGLVAASSSVGASFAAVGNVITFTDRMARLEGRVEATVDTLANTRQRAIDNERDVQRVKTQWEVFQTYYKESQTRNETEHSAILHAIEALK